MRYSTVTLLILLALLAAIGKAGETNTVHGRQASRTVETLPDMRVDVDDIDDTPIWIKLYKQPKIPVPRRVPKTAQHFTDYDWSTAIDETWGPGVSGAEKYSVFDQVWNHVNMLAATFPGTDTTFWDSIKTEFDDIDFDTVSRGQFCGMMQKATWMLSDGHTMAADSIIVQTLAEPGVPLANCFGLGVLDHFGAALTLDPDSAILVYKAIPSHPLGLEPGDLVLGYDGMPWKELYPLILESGMPVYGIKAANEPADAHQWMISAGLNWHLFDTIDVVKHETDDTLHLPTSLLEGQTMQLWATEQMDMAGIPLPDYMAGECVTHGIVEGTNIGYIYHIGFLENAAAQWDAAMQDLMTHYDTDGLIIDIRSNFGGLVAQLPDYKYLFNGVIDYMRTDTRWYGASRLALVNEDAAYPWFIIRGNPGSYYNKPIAVLTGHYAASCGDQIAYALSHHPKAKFFGKPTFGAYNGYASNLQLPIPQWWTVTSTFNTRLIDSTGVYMTRAVFPGPDFDSVPYEDVWLTRGMVAQGQDDVVEAAIDWIIASQDSDGDGVLDSVDNCPDTPNTDQTDLNENGIGDACEPCCGFWTEGYTGNANCDADGMMTLSDITRLIDNVFISKEPLCCEASGNTNASTDCKITLSDITVLIDAVYISKTDPEACMQECEL